MIWWKTDQVLQVLVLTSHLIWNGRNTNFCVLFPGHLDCYNENNISWHHTCCDFDGSMVNVRSSVDMDAKCARGFCLSFQADLANLGQSVIFIDEDTMNEWVMRRACQCSHLPLILIVLACYEWIIWTCAVYLLATHAINNHSLQICFFCLCLMHISN